MTTVEHFVPQTLRHLALSGANSSPHSGFGSYPSSYANPMLPVKLDSTPVYSSPPPASSTTENNTCKLIEYRGTKVAAFDVDGRELICLPQAFELFLKHLVGGLHTVYTKLKRLDIVPVVCNVEQVRVLRGFGAIQPGVNRCKLIAPKEFDILYDDCTNSSARPGRPPKRSILSTTPNSMEKFKKHKTNNGDIFSPRLLEPKKTLNFGNGYFPYSDPHKTAMLPSGFPYPPHLAHLAFMPLSHPSMMNLAMASQLSLRAEQLASLDRASRVCHDQPAHRVSDSCRDLEEPLSLEENNDNNNHHKMMTDADRPLNLETTQHRRSSGDQQYMQSPERYQVTKQHNSSVSDLPAICRSSSADLHYNGHSDEAEFKMADIDRSDADESRDDEDYESEKDEETTLRDIQRDYRLLSHSKFKVDHTQQGHSDISSIETLLFNIQGLLKIVTENVKIRQQQFALEIADLKLKVSKEKESKELLEKQLTFEKQEKVLTQRRLQKEKKIKSQILKQLQVAEAHVTQRHVSHSLYRQQTALDQSLTVKNIATDENNCSAADGQFPNQDELENKKKLDSESQVRHEPLVRVTPRSSVDDEDRISPSSDRATRK